MKFIILNTNPLLIINKPVFSLPKRILKSWRMKLVICYHLLVD